MPSEPSSIRSGLGPAPEPGSRRLSIAPGRRDRADRLDQVVDVRVERREVTAGAGRDPAAERRELERLREVAQRQAVLAQLVLEPRAGRAGLDPRRARGAIDLEHPVEAPQVDRDRARVAVADARLDAADDAGAAAVGDRRRAALARTTRARAATSASSRGNATTSGTWSKRPRNAAHDVAVGLAVGVRRAVVQLGRADLGERGRRLEPRRAAARRPRAQPAPRRRPPRSRGGPRCPPPPPAARRGEGCSSS